MTLAQWLGKFHDQYKGFFSNRQRIASYRIMVEANWNVAINSFSEGYHAAYVHRKTVPDYQGGKKNPQRHRAYLEITEHHGRYSAQANPNRRVTPVEEIAYGHGRPLYPSFPLFSEEGLPLPPGVNASRNENWGFDVAESVPGADLDHRRALARQPVVLAGRRGQDRRARRVLRLQGRDRGRLPGARLFPHPPARGVPRGRRHHGAGHQRAESRRACRASCCRARSSCCSSTTRWPTRCSAGGRHDRRAAAAAAVQRARAVRRRLGADQRSGAARAS